MKIAVSPEQKNFFKHHQFIELDGLFTEKALDSLKNAVRKTLAFRLNTDETRLDKSTAQQLYTAGHDIWRSQMDVKKAITNPQMGEVLYELFDERPLRLAYDQVLPSARYVSFSGAEPKHYAKLTENSAPLEAIGSVQGVLGAVILCLEAPFTPLEGWPSTVGSALIISPNHPIPLQQLQQHTGGLYFVTVYCKDRSVYKVNLNDPHTHSFRQAGYNPGDRLNDKINPVIYR